MSDPMPLELDARLLLYLADELDPQQRLALENQVQLEPALRQRLEALRTADGAIRQAVGQLSATADTPLRAAAAVRDVGRLLRQHQARLQAGAVQPRPIAWGRWVGWSAAAAILVGLFSWALISGGPKIVPPQDLPTHAYLDPQQMDAIEKLRLALGPNGSSESAAQESLTMAEQHLAALLSPGADLPVP